MKTINNNIQEDYVDFDNAKLLKEKGFDIIGQKWYSVEGGLYYQDEFDNNRGFIPVLECEAPTIQLAVKWIYENFGIWIEIYRCNYNSFDYRLNSEFESLMYIKLPLHTSFNSPQEAYQAAIKYVLTQIIK